MTGGVCHTLQQALDSFITGTEPLRIAKLGLRFSRAPCPYQASRLLTEARAESFRIWAVHAPFDFKDILKVRGFRWNDGSDARHNAWFLDVSGDEKDAELTFLETEIYQQQINLPVTTITAKDRFSKRV